MNCLNHPDVAAAAYCQSCGKPLCTACMRSVGGSVYCEPCLQARLSATPGDAIPGSLAGLHAHPLLAGLLGFIPGVGAMYNGQFVKALAHVLIFAVFVSLSDKSVVFSLLLAAWVFYQAFDAAQTAKARRDGLPLPNPFGLNDLGARLGISPAPHTWVGGFPPPGSAPSSAPTGSTGQGSSQNPAGGDPFPPPPPYTASYAAPPAAPQYPPPPVMEPQANRHPVGAVVLIVVGVVLLLQTLGVFEDQWIQRAWPLIVIGLGVWLLYRRTHDTPRGGAQ
jgi:TM2 domain-containing membrane protein YozV